MSVSDKLKEHGWDDQEIDRVDNILNKKQKMIHDHSHKVVYWTILLVLLIANFMISMVLIPFLIIINKIVLFTITASLGALFGVVFSHLIFDLEHLERRHHIFAAVFIPLIGIINIYLMIQVAESVAALFQLQSYQDPFTIALVYAIFFLLPYVITALFKRIKMHH